MVNHEQQIDFINQFYCQYQQQITSISDLQQKILAVNSKLEQTSYKKLEERTLRPPFVVSVVGASLADIDAISEGVFRIVTAPRTVPVPCHVTLISTKQGDFRLNNKLVDCDYVSSEDWHNLILIKQTVSRNQYNYDNSNVLLNEVVKKSHWVIWLFNPRDLRDGFIDSIPLNIQQKSFFLLLIEQDIAEAEMQVLNKRWLQHVGLTRQQVIFANEKAAAKVRLAVKLQQIKKLPFLEELLAKLALFQDTLTPVIYNNQQLKGKYYDVYRRGVTCVNKILANYQRQTSYKINHVIESFRKEIDLKRAVFFQKRSASWWKSLQHLFGKHSYVNYIENITNNFFNELIELCQKEVINSEILKPYMIELQPIVDEITTMMENDMPQVNRRTSKMVLLPTPKEQQHYISQQQAIFNEQLHKTFNKSTIRLVIGRDLRLNLERKYAASAYTRVSFIIAGVVTLIYASSWQAFVGSYLLATVIALLLSRGLRYKQDNIIDDLSRHLWLEDQAYAKSVRQDIDSFYKNTNQMFLECLSPIKLRNNNLAQGLQPLQKFAAVLPNQIAHIESDIRLKIKPNLTKIKQIGY